MRMCFLGIVYQMFSRLHWSFLGKSSTWSRRFLCHWQAMSYKRRRTSKRLKIVEKTKKSIRPYLKLGC